LYERKTRVLKEVGLKVGGIEGRRVLGGASALGSEKQMNNSKTQRLHPNKKQMPLVLHLLGKQEGKNLNVCLACSKKNEDIEEKKAQ